MALEAATGVLTVPTGAVGTTLAVNCGFTTKAKAILLVCIAGRTDAVDAVGGANLNACLGIGTSDTNRFAVATSCTDNVAASDGTKRRTNAAIFTMVPSAAVEGALDLDAVANWPADGFQLIVDDQFVNAYKVQWFAWGGSDLTDATCVQFQEPAATGTQDITSPAFTVSDDQGAVIFISDQDNTAPPNTQTARASKLMLGWATSPSHQGVTCWADDQGVTEPDTDSYIRGSECIAFMPDTVSTVVDGRASFNNWITNGFQLNWAERASTRYIFALVMKGGLWTTGDFLTRTDTNDITTENTGFGFTPNLVLVASAMRGESASDTPTVHGAMSVGGADSPTNRHAQALFHENNPGGGGAGANTEICTAIEYDAVGIGLNTSDTLDALYDIAASGFLADGITFKQDDADVATNFVIYLACGNAPAAGTTDIFFQPPEMFLGSWSAIPY